MSDKPKATMTEKQKLARLANLEAGRKKRMELIKQRKDNADTEYDISSSDENNTESDSDSEGFVISKKKQVKKPTKKRDIKTELDELKNIVMDMAVMQKKKKNKSQPKSGGTKIVVLPNNNNHPQPNQYKDLTVEALMKSLL